MRPPMEPRGSRGFQEEYEVRGGKGVMQIENDGRVRGDAAAVRQVSASLLSNATQEP